MLRCLQLLVVIAIAVTFSSCKREAAPHAEGGDSLVVVDARGSRVALPAHVARAVSLAPNLTEMIFAVGGGARLVGATRFCTYPDSARLVERVGDLQTPDYERIAALHPDVVLMTSAGNLPPAYDRLRALDVPVVVLDATSIDGIELTLRQVGHIFSCDSAAAHLVDTLCAQVDSARAAARRRPPVDAVIVLSLQPLIAVGHGFLDELLVDAGGRNIAHNDLVQYPQISRETLLATAPRVIIVPSDAPPDADVWRTFPEWARLRAGGTRLARIDADLLMRPGPRVGLALRLLQQALAAPVSAP